MPIRPEKKSSQPRWRWVQSATNLSPRLFPANRENNREFRTAAAGNDAKSPLPPASSRIVPRNMRDLNREYLGSEQGISTTEQGILRAASEGSLPGMAQDLGGGGPSIDTGGNELSSALQQISPNIIHSRSSAASFAYWPSAVERKEAAAACALGTSTVEAGRPQ
jgi:hypothetical protein